MKKLLSKLLEVSGIHWLPWLWAEESDPLFPAFFHVAFFSLLQLPALLWWGRWIQIASTQVWPRFLYTCKTFLSEIIFILHRSEDSVIFVCLLGVGGSSAYNTLGKISQQRPSCAIFSLNRMKRMAPGNELLEPRTASGNKSWSSKCS